MSTYLGGAWEYTTSRILSIGLYSGQHDCGRRIMDTLKYRDKVTLVGFTDQLMYINFKFRISISLEFKITYNNLNILILLT